jgi:hypothetical protein
MYVVLYRGSVRGARRAPRFLNQLMAIELDKLTQTGFTRPVSGAVRFCTTEQ